MHENVRAPAYDAWRPIRHADLTSYSEAKCAIWARERAVERHFSFLCGFQDGERSGRPLPRGPTYGCRRTAFPDFEQDLIGESGRSGAKPRSEGRSTGALCVLLCLSILTPAASWQPRHWRTAALWSPMRPLPQVRWLLRRHPQSGRSSLVALPGWGVD